MATFRPTANTLRPREHLLWWAFGVSVFIHLLIYADWLGEHRFHLDLFPSWLQPEKKALAELKKPQVVPPPERPVQLVFVDVDPSASVKDAPKDAKYYSSHNSKAANVDATVQADVPKMDGSQEHMPQTQSVPKSKAVPLQPSPPKQPSATEAATEAKAKPKGGPEIGDLAMTKPLPQRGDNTNEGDAGEAPKPEHTRPRTLADAKARLMPGEKMKQNGGVQSDVHMDTLDARGTSFGEYDRELIDAIKNRWYDLLDRKEFSRDRTGKVVVEFRLNYDGHISNLHVVENGVDELLAYVCEKAITDPNPYAPWPADMRRELAADHRDIRFTFFYE